MIKKIVNHFLTDFFSFCILILLSAFLINNFASAQNIQNNSFEKKKQIVKTKKKRQITSAESFYGKMNSTSSLIQKNLLQPYYANNFLFTSELFAYQDQPKGKSFLNLSNTFFINNLDDMNLKFYFNYLNKLDNSSSSDFSDFYTQLYFSNLLGSDQNLNNLKGTQHTNPSFNPNLSLNIKPYLISILPLSKDSQEDQKLNLALGGGLESVIPIKVTDFIILGKLNFSLLKLFQKNETSRGNISNFNYLSNQLAQIQTLFSNFTGSLIFKRTQGMNYDNQQVNTVAFNQKISWSLSKNLTLSFGHSDILQITDVYQEEIPLTQDQNKTSFFYSSIRILI